MQLTAIELYDLLKSKIGEKEAGSLVGFVETKSEEGFQNKMEILATKAQVSEVKSDLIKWMFIFWIGQIAVVSGIMIAVLNAYLR